jgi:hypothetical protein
MKPGEKTARLNRDQKHVLGHAANSVANKFLSKRRGEVVMVRLSDELFVIGKLLEFDLYSLVVDVPGEGESLIFKGPGIRICSQ